MNPLPTARRAHWRHALVVAASCAWMICSVHSPARLAAASTCVGWCSDSLQSTDLWNTFTAEMRVNRRHVRGTGAAIGVPAPATSYRIERSNRTGSWKTVVTVLSVDRPPTYALTGAITQPAAFPVGRIEDDEDGSPVRAYGTRQQLLAGLPSSVGAAVTSLLPRSGGREWIEGFVATTANRSRRLQALERRFGKGAKLGALMRYSRKDGDLDQEVLVDSRSVVPVEQNNTINGTRMVHRTYSYGAAPNDAVVRTSVHAETLVAPTLDDRAIVDTAFFNIRLEQRR